MTTSIGQPPQFHIILLKLNSTLLHIWIHSLCPQIVIEADRAHRSHTRRTWPGTVFSEDVPLSGAYMAMGAICLVTRYSRHHSNRRSPHMLQWSSAEILELKNPNQCIHSCTLPAVAICAHCTCFLLYWTIKMDMVAKRSEGYRH